MQMHSSPVLLDGWLQGRWRLGLTGLGGNSLWSVKIQHLLVSLEVCVHSESASYIPV